MVASVGISKKNEWKKIYKKYFVFRQKYDYLCRKIFDVNNMDNVDKTPATEESIWALFREANRQRKEDEEKSNREMAGLRNSMAESSTKFDREMAEFRNSMAESDAKFDREMAEFRNSMAESSSKFDREMAEFRKETAEYRKATAESGAKFDREMAEYRKALAESDAKFDKQIKQINESIGGISNSTGFFAEEYFFNSFENGKKTFSVKSLIK